jgi:hypothetical protein
MAFTRPLTDRELRALLVDCVDYTLPQARAVFADYRRVEDEMPNDNYAATVTNMLDAIFYMRFGGRWRATAAPHVFQPSPTVDCRTTRTAAAIPAPERSIIRSMTRSLFK